MESQASQTQIVDLTGGEVAEIEEAGVPVSAHYNQDKIEGRHPPILTSQTAGPITRYVMFPFTGFMLPRHGTSD